jgi:hypothetical protein
MASNRILSSSKSAIAVEARLQVNTECTIKGITAGQKIAVGVITKMFAPLGSRLKKDIFMALVKGTKTAR